MAEYNPWKRANWNLTNQMRIEKSDPRKAAYLRFMAEYPEYDEEVDHEERLLRERMINLAVAANFATNPPQLISAAEEMVKYVKGGTDAVAKDDAVDVPAPKQPEQADAAPSDPPLISTPIATDLTLSNAQSAPVPNGAA